MWTLLPHAPYHVLNEITVSKKALIHNFQHFAADNPHACIVPMLKSNAYGHGLIPTARLIDTHLSAPFIGVDSLFEAYELTKHHIRTPILILGYTFPENFHLRKRLPFSFSVFDCETLQALHRYQPGAKIHIKLDTGMSRLGLLPHEIAPFITVLKKCPHIHVEGIYSHLSCADSSRQKTRSQIALFKQMVDPFEAAGYRFTYKHIAATAGASWITDPYFNLIRLGLGFYGYSSFSPQTSIGKKQRHQLMPALTLTSHLAQVKTITAKSSVGYGDTYTTNKPLTIGILPIGYADGINRLLSNLGSVTINNQPCPIRGRVSMNMTTIEIPANHPAKAGDAVTIIDSHQKSPNSIDQLARCINTIPYTILTGLNPTIRRTFV